MSRFEFSSKAEVLERLSDKLVCSRLLPIVHFTREEWLRDSSNVLGRIKGEAWASGTMIVRSSAVGEDGVQTSLAGLFQTIKEVGIGQLASAIEQVFESYGREGRDNNIHDRVLVQPMLSSVRASGVIFSRDPSTGAPHYVISLSRGSDTSMVTGGRAGRLDTYYVFHTVEPEDLELRCLVAMVRELQMATGQEGLDIEFGLDIGALPVLFQVRPLISVVSPLSDQRHQRIRERVQSKLIDASGPHPYLHGRQSVFGVMPDWNPAEIIGIRPRPLALSLYRELVTDSVWAYQRHNYGYKNLRSFPLLIDLCGLPYIDVRVSFNSFIPDQVSPDLADRLVDYYIDRLIAFPTLHDKVEFEIVFSCYSFDLPGRLADLPGHIFSQQDIDCLTDNLRSLTNRIINHKTGLWLEDIERIRELERRHATVMTAELDEVSRIYWLLEHCKRYGTLPFAGLARAGFIAMQMIDSLVRLGIFSHSDRERFMSGINTITAEMSSDLRTLDYDLFLQKYGHLRPGTYDILSPRYDEEPDLYFDITRPPLAAQERQMVEFELTAGQRQAIATLLKRHGLGQDVDGLFAFFREAIRGREYSKFIFTRSLSDSLSLLKRLGSRYGLTPDDMSYLSVRSVYDLYTSSDDIEETLCKSIEAGRRRFADTHGLTLPPLITSQSQAWSFVQHQTEPNFVTLGSAMGRVILADARSDLKDAIVLIQSADPGYDWIFSRGIAGLITCYGGVNSHMAIRASELAIPAVVGAGESNFSQWGRAEILSIDCMAKQVRIIR